MNEGWDGEKVKRKYGEMVEGEAGNRKMVTWEEADLTFFEKCNYDCLL